MSRRPTPTPRNCPSTWNGPPAPAATWPRCDCVCCGPKGAATPSTPFTEDKLLAKSRYHGLGLYYHGFASFQLKDDLAAGRSLSQLAPFTDPVFGAHARYLLARVHHNDGEREEAAAQYQGVIDDYAKQKQDAVETLKQPDRFKNDPDEKARLEALVRDPPPDHVARAAFFLGVMQYEDGKFGEALTQLTAFVQQFPTSPLVAEAQLRQGFCQVQLKQFADAQKTLTPLADKEPRLADQCLLWIAKAQIGAADPNNAPAYDQALKTAQNTFRKAADRAKNLANADPEARTRRGEILLELADAQQLTKQYKDAAGTYNQILNEKLLPQREEEMVQDLAAAQHLAGDYAESDKVCDRFRTSYPKSPLLPAVLFRYAENAYFSALAADKLPNPADRQRETANGWTRRSSATRSSSKSTPNRRTSTWRATAWAWHITRRAIWIRRKNCWRRSRRPTATATWRLCRTSWPTS